MPIFYTMLKSAVLSRSIPNKVLGIGRALARELVSQGFNIVLHGRNLAKLAAVQSSLQKEFPEREFRIVIADAAQLGEKAIEAIEGIVDSLKDIHLTVLVNNVGGHPPEMKPLLQPFHTNTTRDIDGAMGVNFYFAVHLTKRVIPLFLQHKKPSLVLNIGSMAEQGLPWMVMYGAGKSFVRGWTTALGREMRLEGWDVEVLGINLLNVTNISFRKERATWVMPEAETFARAVIQKVGCGRRGLVMGYWVHGIVGYVYERFPEGLLQRIMEGVIREEAGKEKKRE